MNVTEALITVIMIASLPWLLWMGLRNVWLRWRERRVLSTKYGDLEMFSRQLEEWGVPRSKRTNGNGAP